MKATDLRIRNLVYNVSSRKEIVVTVKTLLYFSEIYYKPIPITPELLERAGFEKFHVKYLDPRWMIRHYKNKGDKIYNEYHFELTEWLDETKGMCGVMGVYHAEMKNVSFPTEDDLLRTKDIPESLYNFAFHIKYIHQLQNLYFALTQKELEIK